MKRKREEQKLPYLYMQFPFMRHLLNVFEDSIERVEEKSLTISTFTKKYDEKSRPCLILGSSILRKERDHWNVKSLSNVVKSNDKVSMMAIREPPERIAGMKRGARYVKVSTVSVSLSLSGHKNTHSQTTPYLYSNTPKCYTPSL